MYKCFAYIKKNKNKTSLNFKANNNNKHSRKTLNVYL